MEGHRYRPTVRTGHSLTTYAKRLRCIHTRSSWRTCTTKAPQETQAEATDRTRLLQQSTTTSSSRLCPTTKCTTTGLYSSCTSASTYVFCQQQQHASTSRHYAPYTTVQTRTHSCTDSTDADQSKQQAYASDAPDASTEHAHAQHTFVV